LDLALENLPELLLKELAQLQEVLQGPEQL
jgi:hypothetical protein